jgi:hypothetical protein
MSQIVCPHCDYAGVGTATDIHGENGGAECNGFYLLEDITAYRFVRGVAGGRLVVDGLYHTGEGYDEGVAGSLRLECRRCLSEFALPPGVDIEWE